MENLTRESILRMVGLHDSAQFMRQVNAIQMTLEQQGSDMVAYWTEIRKDERQISLIAGRVSANETSIGQLQIQANAISLSVQSLSTTVNGDGTQGSGLVSRVSSLELTESSISQRVTVIEGDYVKNAQISLMVTKDGNGYISNALIDADRVSFVFTQVARFVSKQGTTEKEVMNINPNGDLWILGDLKGGSIQGNYTVGTTGNKMQIYVDEVSQGYVTTSGIRGYDQNNNKLLDLRVLGTSSSSVGGELYLTGSSGYQSRLYPNLVAFDAPNGGGSATFGYDSNGKVYIYAPISRWPSLSGSTLTGQVYLDSNGFLKVRTS